MTAEGEYCQPMKEIALWNRFRPQRLSILLGASQAGTVNAGQEEQQRPIRRAGAQPRDLKCRWRQRDDVMEHPHEQHRPPNARCDGHCDGCRQYSGIPTF